MGAPRDRADLADLKRRLGDHAVDICQELFGEPTKRHSHECRWGRRGSVRLILHRRGWHWSNFESGDSGSLLDAIVFALNLDLVGAIRWATEWLGESIEDRSRVRKSAPTLDVDADEERRQQQALAIWKAGGAVDGTPAGAYLRQHRAVDADFTPDVARYVKAADIKRCRPEWHWWRWSALILAATDVERTITAVQVVALQHDGRAAIHWSDTCRKLKMTLGRLGGSAVRLPGISSEASPLALGEGFETTASGWWAGDIEARAYLGSITKAQLDDVPVSRPIVIFADDDERYAPANRAVNKKIANWRREGRTVVEVKPWCLTRGDKSDLNDLLREEGRDVVRMRIRAALDPPPVAVARLDVEEARRHVADHIADAFAALKQRQGGAPAPFKVVRVGVGIGKTKYAIERVVSPAYAGEQIAFLVPTHKLTAELAERIRIEADRRDGDIRIDVWRGREAARHPEHPTALMCNELETVQQAQAAHLNPARFVCPACPGRGGCPYLQQHERKAEIWIGAHDLLLNPPPPPMRGTSLLVIEEGFVHHLGVIGPAGDPVLLSRDDLLNRAIVAQPTRHRRSTPRYALAPEARRGE